MKYYTITPPPDLASYIRFFWILESTASPDQPYYHRSLADGSAELIFHYQSQFDELSGTAKRGKTFTSGVHGQSQFYRRFVVQQNFGIFGVYLFPFAIPYLFSIPASDLSNQMPDLTSLLGKAGSELEEKVMLAADNHHRADVISTFFRNKLSTKSVNTPPAVFSAIKQIIATKGVLTVSQLADQTCLSTRQFERHFKTFAGFSPKLYSRIIRFQAVLNEYDKPEKSLTQISLDCGYYDQSHFIHEFKEFSGHHPRIYFSGQSESTAYKESE